MDTAFEGQQSDERILYTVVPHPMGVALGVAEAFLVGVVVFLFCFGFSRLLPQFGVLLVSAGIVITFLLTLVSYGWNKSIYGKTRTYITDRRIMRIEAVTPFYTARRALFWNEALKAKAYQPSLFKRMFNVGTLKILPVMGGEEDITVSDVYYYNDLANYIDKILFVFKNKPQGVAELMPFVPKPRGKRG